MENKNVNLLIGAFAALLIGVSLIGVIATEEQKVTSLTQVNNELIDITAANNGSHINPAVTFTVANPRTEQWKLENSECDMVTRAYGNSTVTFTPTTDYTFSTSGVITLVNTAKVVRSSNTTYIDYDYCEDDYLNAGWNRTVLDLVLGFFAIGLLLVAVGLFYQVMKNEGLVNF